MWQAEVLIRGEWVSVACCESKFVASLALTTYELRGYEVRLTRV